MANNLLMLIKLDTDTMVFASLLVSIVGAVAAISAAYYANIAAFYAKKAATKRDLARVEQNTQHAEHFSNKILSIDTSMQPQEKQEDSQAQQERSQAHVEQKTSPAQQEASMAQSQQEASQVPTQGEAPLVQSQQEASQAKAQAQPQASRVPAQRISISVEGEAMGEVPLELFLTLQDSSIRVSRVEMVSEAGKNLGSSPCKATDKALVFKSILAPKKVRQWWAGESTREGEGRSNLRAYLLLDESGREVYRDIPVSIVEDLRNVGITSLVVWTIKGSI
jgi:flagellar biosynthesis GTPase FlhF